MSLTGRGGSNPLIRTGFPGSNELEHSCTARADNRACSDFGHELAQNSTSFGPVPPVRCVADRVTQKRLVLA